MGRRNGMHDLSIVWNNCQCHQQARKTSASKINPWSECCTIFCCCNICVCCGLADGVYIVMSTTYTFLPSLSPKFHLPCGCYQVCMLLYLWEISHLCLRVSLPRKQLPGGSCTIGGFPRVGIVHLGIVRMIFQGKFSRGNWLGWEFSGQVAVL